VPDKRALIVYLLSANKNRLHFLPAFAWGMLILAVISIPAGSIPKTALFQFPHFDKVVHFSMFAVFGILLFVGFFNNMGRGATAAWKHVSASLFAGILFGVLTEYLQFCCIESRHGNLADVFTNSFGTIFGVFMMVITRRRSRVKP